MLERLYLAVAHARIVRHQMDNGASLADAHATASAVTAGGVVGVLGWIVQHAPELYAFAQFIAALFGVPLPPLPPIPLPTTPAA